jgi:glycosyltransferase involved in cell wall biosynthesis
MPTANPLVSVIVISYNSSDYIIETLESVLNQSYTNIELIISDDCSSDDTLAMSEKWLTDNNSRFCKSQIVSTSQNSGIPGNCNRGIKHSTGDWLKIIAADDILIYNCIEKNIQFVSNNVGTKILLSDIVHFLDGTNPKQILETTRVFWQGKNPQTAKDQYQLLLKSYCGNTPSFFIARSVFDDFLYDETFFFIEDYPFVLNATKRGFFINYMPEETILYRVRNDSVFFTGGDEKIFTNFYLKKQLFDEIYRYPYISKTRKNYELFNYKRLKVLEYLHLNRKSAINNFIFVFSRYLNPYRYLIAVRKDL